MNRKSIPKEEKYREKSMSKTIVLEQEAIKSNSTLMNQVYRLRYDVFTIRKKWVEENSAQKDIDVYDSLPPVHFVHVNNEGEVDGCCRIIPTAGPYMLKDIFPELAGGNTLPENETVWEISRFAVDKDRTQQGSQGGSLVVSEILISLFEYALLKNIERIVAVTETGFEKVLRRAGLYTERFAPPRMYHNCEAVAGFAEANRETLSLLKERYQERLDVKNTSKKTTYKSPDPFIVLTQSQDLANRI